MVKLKRARIVYKLWSVVLEFGNEKDAFNKLFSNACQYKCSQSTALLCASCDLIFKLTVETGIFRKTYNQEL